MDENFSPMIYDHNTIFGKLRQPELGIFNDDGVFQFADEESTFKAIGYFYEILFEIESKLDAFAMKELRPFLL